MPQVIETCAYDNDVGRVSISNGVCVGRAFIYRLKTGLRAHPATEHVMDAWAAKGCNEALKATETI